MSTITQAVHELQIQDLLNRLRGKKATLLLDSGASFTGVLADVDYAAAPTQLVHIQTLEGSEFFDAVVTKNRIVGATFRVKG